MSSKDEMVANFQACTGIEDCGKAFTCLDSCDWDLHRAINQFFNFQNQDSVIPGVAERGVPISSIPSAIAARPIEEVDVISIDSPSKDIQFSPSSSSNSFDRNASSSSVVEPLSIPSSSQQHPEVYNLQISIEGLEDGKVNGTFPLEIPGSTTFGELQNMLHQLIGIPPCSQFLEGFEKPVVPNTVITRDLLPKNMSLTLFTSSSTINQYERPNGSVMDEFTLVIRDEKNGKEYKLPYPVSTMIRKIKTDVFHLSGIQVRHQVWDGWPSQVDENSTLAILGASKEHKLSVSQQPERTPKSHRKVAKNLGDASEDNSSADEFEDASELLPEDDFIIMCDFPSQSSQPLIPANTTDEVTAVKSFIKEFKNRYGTCCPPFYSGTLNNALNESVLLPAKTRKPLAVYLHHDKSVLANVFCSQSLCDKSVVDYLQNNYVIWGWDLTHESNEEMLLQLFRENLGFIAENTVRGYSLDKLPALLIIDRNRGSKEILSVIHGNAILDEVMTSLLHANEIFKEQRKAEVLEETQREQRELMMAEQDAAYNASLEADRAKAQAKRRTELEEQVERQRQQSIKEQEDAMKEAVRASLEMELPPEPGPECAEPTTILRFRVPKKEPFSRVFTRYTKLQTVLNFLCVKGYPPDEYKYIQAWPRICLTSLDSLKTLEELKMPNQETITVEERTDDRD